MLLNDLLKAADVLESAGDCSANVSSLEFDSRRVTPGALFFATRGTQADGHAFIEAAVGAGAVAVVCETMPERLAEGVAYLRVADSSVALGRMASAFYGDPSRSLRLVGVTGTNGKTTTATLLYRLFRSLGYKAGLISTVTYCIDSERRESTHTTPDSVRLNRMMAEMPERCFDVGIAEGHAVTFSAGLAAAGMIPFCNIYSSFMQRAYDNVIHDVALQHLNVVMCLDRAGLVGEDGPTHHGVFDIACMRSIPNLTIASPMNEVELRNLMYTASLGRGPFVIRYPRGEGVTPQWRQPFEEIPLGRSRLLRDGSDVAVLTFGPVGNAAAAAIRRAAAEGVSAAHIDLRFAKPLDTDRLHATGRKFRRIVTVEDGAIAGGVGSAVLEFMSRNGYAPGIDMLGVPDRFVRQGTQSQLREICGIDEQSIYEAIMKSKQQ